MKFKKTFADSKYLFTFALPETQIKTAQVAKLVDALCSGRSVRKDVLVRIQSWAQEAEGVCYVQFLPFLILFLRSTLLHSHSSYTHTQLHSS